MSFDGSATAACARCSSWPRGAVAEPDDRVHGLGMQEQRSPRSSNRLRVRLSRSPFSCSARCP
ncbi:hypothetical protein AURDEDRAFT_114689 [Auricularia subglabra TFB-10046 SS5]|nr:hypothetical protein AURDEDRAFT_114689 [Auricularia subglabra TFB-10046 SS5]